MLGEVEDMFPSLEEGESRLCRRSLGVRRLEGEVGGGGSGGLRALQKRGLMAKFQRGSSSGPLIFTGQEATVV